MLTKMLELVAFALLAIIAVLVLYCLVATCILCVKSLIKTAKGGEDNERDREP